MSAPTFVNCTQVDRIVPEQKFRVTIELADVASFLFGYLGGNIPNIYASLSQSPWCYVVSEPPIDNQSVLVADIRISKSTVGSSPLGSVAELVNSLNDLVYFSSSYNVTRVERLTTTSPVLEQRSRVIQEAVVHQAASGVTGTVQGLQHAIGSALGGAKTVVIVLAVAAGAVALVYLAKELRAARTA